MSALSRKPERRRRADAERSIQSILEAAISILAERPDAGMGTIAAAAGVTRQTIYAHFPHREALIAAVADRLTRDTMAALDAAHLDQGPATEALIRLIDTSWEGFAAAPALLQAIGTERGTASDDRHPPVTERLVQLIRRGQATGEFDADLSAEWLAAATIGLGHTAGDEVGAGRLTPDEAVAALRVSLLRLVGAVTDRRTRT